MTAFIDITEAEMVFNTRKGRFHALRDINLKIDQGEFITLIGHSGCGKSTLLNLIAGLLTPTGGGLICDGREIAAPGPDRAVVFQNHSLLPWLNCFENVYLAVERVFGTKEGKEKLKARTNAALEMVHMAHAAQKLPHEISGGMKQRIGIARALAVNPELIICDEPVSALDVSIQAQILNLLLDLQKEMNLTYIFISHDLAVVKFIADDVAVMYNGKIVEKANKRLEDLNISLRSCLNHYNSFKFNLKRHFMRIYYIYYWAILCSRMYPSYFSKYTLHYFFRFQEAVISSFQDGCFHIRKFFAHSCF
jgi:nitrate/nitrite transport system ATP-binding protein